MSTSRSTTATRGRRARRTLAAAATLVLVGVGLSACTPSSSSSGASAAGGDEPSSSASPAGAPPVRLRAMVGRDPQSVPLTREVSVSARNGRLQHVQVDSKAGPLGGRLSKQSNTWAAEGRLEPGTDYVVHAVAERSDGKRVTRTTRFHTEDLSLAQQTYASVAPLQGETVGVGMPVIVTFDVPVTDKSSIEKHMSVTSAPQQPGSWHWLSDTEVHWRPKSYWQAGTDVSVDVDVNSVPAGAGIYGQESRHVDFQVGDANVYKVNAQTDQMQVFQNGSLLRTIPITTGKPGFTTRSGTKVIIEKFDSKRMNSETVGIPTNSDEGYDLDDVKWAMRLTYSGEFIHAAPWSVGSQGVENVSHGCTGMSTENAAWLYSLSRRGDVVEYTGTDRSMTLDNGYGDWNASYDDYRSGSALS
jgi:lipoprotein-anchoring transpeptidase ErfK/SrfK